MMFKAVGLQFAAVVLGALVALLSAGAIASMSFALGGLAAAVPNALFALRLSVHQNKAAETYPAVFFVGELVKVVLTIGFLGLIVKSWHEVSGLALLMGLIVVLKAPLLMFWVGRSGTDPVVSSLGS
jgi:ATP synthase protein I